MKKIVTKIASAALLMFLMFGIGAKSYAQATLTVHDGTTTNSYIPLYGLYTDDYERGQFVMPASELSAMSGCNITDMTFYLSTSPSSAWQATFQVYMTEVASSTISSFVASSTATTVYQGTLSVSNSQMTVTFTTPYVYGGGNLLIGFDVISPSNWSSASFYGETVSNSSISGYSSSSVSAVTPNQRDFLPKTTFTFTPMAGYCFQAANVVADSVTDQSAYVSWTQGDTETSWNIRYGVAGFDPDLTAGIDNYTSMNYSVTGLNPDTQYDFCIQSNCDSSQVSTWKRISFRTTCAPLSADMLPYTEGFEDYGTGSSSAISQCWFKNSTSSTAYPYPYSSAAITGNRGLYFYSYNSQTSTPTECWAAITPVASSISVSDLMLSFNIKRYSTTSSYYNTMLKVGVMTDPADITTFVEVITVDITDQPASSVHSFELPLSAYTGTGKYIALYSPVPPIASGNSYSYNYVYLDDVVVDFTPTCFHPSVPVISNVTENSAVVKWTPANAAQNSFAVAYGTDTDPLNMTIVNATADSIVLTNLTDATSYNVYVKAICSATDESSWSPMASFCTTMIPFVVTTTTPFVEDFETPNTWTLENGSNINGWFIGSATANGNSAGINSMYISNDNGTSNTYNNTQSAMVYAYKTLNLSSGVHHISYDWNANGESTYDYLRVYLAPASMDLTAATAVPTGFSTTSLPAGAVALDGGEKLNLASGWSTHTEDFAVAAAGNYNLVFAWRNDGSQGSNPPAAVDNITLSQPTCPNPYNFRVTNMTANGISLAWNAGGNESAWNVRYAPSADTTTWTTINATTPSVTINGLQQVEYMFELQAACSATETSEWVGPITLVIGSAEVEIGTGTSSDYITPFNNYYKNSWTQIIYPASEFTVPGMISEISFYVGATGSFTFSTLDIYLGTKASATHSGTTDWIPMNDLELVYSATNLAAPSATGWWTLTLDNPYFYDGSENLVVVTSKTSSSYSSSLKFNYTSVTGSVIYRRSDSDASCALHPGSNSGDSSSERANVRFTFSFDANICMRPSVATVDSVTTSEAYISWAADSASVWNLKYGPRGFDAETQGTLVSDIMDNSYVITGLAASTLYDVCIQTVCDTNSVSSWRRVQFQTECGELTMPYFTDFDSETGSTSGTSNNLPICWDYYNNGTYSSYTGYPIIYNSSSSAYSGNNFLRFYSSYSSTQNYYGNQVAIMPPVNNVSELQLNFYARQNSTSSSYQTSMYVGVMSDPEDITTFVAVDTIHPAGSSYEEFTVYFNQYQGTGNYIAMRVDKPTTSGTYRSMYVDDIEVDYIPACIRPKDITVLNVDESSVTIDWTDIETGTTEWQVEYGTDGHTPGTGTIVTVTNKPATITGLASGTMYDIYVRGVCGYDSLTQEVITSQWTKHPAKFNTLASCGGNMTASVMTIGTATTGTYSIPINTYFHYSLSEQIFTTSDLFSAGLVEASINTIAFQYIYGTAQQPKPIKIYMGITSKDQFNGSGDWISLDSLTLVFNGTVQFNNQGADNWFDILLNAPFYYDGTGNLVVAVENLSDEFSTSSNNTFTYHEVGGNQTIYAQSDSSPVTTSSSGTVSSKQNNMRFYGCIPEGLCMPPMSLYASDIDTASVTINWTSVNTPNGWTFEYGPSGFEAGTGTLVQVTDTTQTSLVINNLLSNVLYDVYGWSHCDEGNSVKSKCSFRTLCGYTTGIPYVENFDAYEGTTLSSGDNNLPSCWDYINLGTTYTNYPVIYNSSSSSYSGNNSLRFYSYNTSSYADQYAILPNMSNISGLQLSFAARAYSTSTYSTYHATVIIGVMDAAGTQASFEPYDTINLTRLNYEEFNIYMSLYQGTGTRIAFKAEKYSDGYNSLNIDNIRVDYMPECPMVDNVKVLSSDTSSATLKWTVYGTETSWIVEYGPKGFTLGTGTQVTVNTNQATITGLDNSSAYDVYIQSGCGSEWRGPKTFYTAQTPAAMPYSCGFEANDPESGKWTLENGDQFNQWAIGSDMFHYGTYAGQQGLYISYEMVDAPLGLLNYYDNTQASSVYAYRTFDLSAGPHVVTYKWKCMGEEGDDYIRAFLAPASAVLSAGNTNGITATSTPDGWIALGGELSNDTAWNTYYNEDLNITDPGYYNLVFYWRNDGSQGEFPAPAIDNVQLFALTCPLPNNVTCQASDVNSATIAWTELGDATQWNLEYGPKGFAQGNGTVVPANTNPFTITGLQAAMQYDVYVQSVCGADDMSGWRGPCTFNTATCYNYDMCPIYLHLEDQVFDGWNNAAVEVYTNGIFINSYTVNNGSQLQDYTVQLCPGTITFKWHVGDMAMFNNECSITIYSSDSTQLFAINSCENYTEGQTIFEFNHECNNVGCPAPTNLNVVEVNNGVKITWSATTEATSYNIYRNNVKIVPNITATTYTDTQIATNGNYCYKVSANCDGGIESMPTEPACVDTHISVGENAAESARIYPNPTNSKVKVEAAGMTRIDIMSILGQKVYSTEFEADEFEFDFGNLEAGVYMMRIETITGSATKRISVVK